MPDILGVSTKMPNHHDLASRQDLVTPAARRWPEENAECAARRPVAEVARLHGLLAQFLGVADRDLKENLLAPDAGARPDRQCVPHGFSCLRVVEFGLGTHRASLDLHLPLHRATGYRLLPPV